jgi:hypothetical protein
MPLALPVADQGSLELREGAHDLELKHRERVRRPRNVEGKSLLEEPHLETAGSEFADQPVEVDHGPGEAVHGGDDDGVLVADVGQHRFEGRAVGAAA